MMLKKMKKKTQWVLRSVTDPPWENAAGKRQRHRRWIYTLMCGCVCRGVYRGCGRETKLKLKEFERKSLVNLETKPFLLVGLSSFFFLLSIKSIFFF